MRKFSSYLMVALKGFLMGSANVIPGVSGGTIAFLGLSFGGDSVIPFDVNEAIFNKTTLRPVFAEPAIDFALATELIKQNKVDASLFQTHTFSFHNAKEHFAAALSGNLPVIKSVFLPWE